jgi:tetratricopeptide (TPR) repeat protein
MRRPVLAWAILCWLTAGVVLSGPGSANGDRGGDTTRATRVTITARPWLHEAEFAQAPSLRATPDQVVILHLEPAAQGSRLIRNTLPYLVEQTAEFTFCLPADDLYLRAMELVRESQRVVRLSRTRRCAIWCANQQLGCASARGAVPDNAVFSNAYLSGVDMSGSTGQGVNFGGAVLVGVNFSGAQLAGDPLGASLEFTNGFLPGADFTNVTVAGADFAGAYVDFTHSSGDWAFLLGESYTGFTGYWHTPQTPVCAELGESALQGQASHNLGQTYYAIDDFGHAAELLRWHVEAADRESGTPSTPLRIRSQAWLARTLRALGAFAEGRPDGKEALRLATLEGRGTTLTVVHDFLGYLYLAQGDLEHAIQVCDESLALCRASGNRADLGVIAAFLGYASALQGRLAERRSLLEEAISKSICMGARQRSLWVAWFSEICRLAGRSDEAWQYARQALALARQQKARGEEAHALHQLGAV